MVVGGDGADGVVRAFLRSFYCSKSKRRGSMFIPKKSKNLEFQKSDWSRLFSIKNYVTKPNLIA